MAIALQVKQSLPTRITADFGAAPSTVVLEGADPDRTATIASHLPTFQQYGATNRYTGNLICDELGKHTLYVYDGSSNLLEQFDIDCVRATDREVALGCQNKNVGPYAHWPGDTIVPPAVTVWLPVGSTATAYFNVGRFEFQTSGEMGLVDIYLTSAFNGMTKGAATLKVFTGYWTDDGTDYRMRSISENLVNNTQSNGTAIPATSAWYRLKLERMLRHEPGDFLGVIVQKTDGNVSFLAYLPIAENWQDVTDMYSGATTGDATSELTVNGTAYAGNALLIKPVIERPAFAIGGHSVWSGGNDIETASAPIWSTATNNTEYVADYDPAVYLSELLDMPVVNLAEGSTATGEWIGSGGNMAEQVADVAPAVMFYDSVINEWARTTSDFLANMEHLLAHCDAIGTRLVLLESPPAKSVRDGDYWEGQLEKLGALRRWADAAGVPYIQMRLRLGTPKSGDELWSHSYQKTSLSGISDYMASGDNTHLTRAGRNAAMRAIADAINSGLQSTPSFNAYTATLEDVEPTATLIDARQPRYNYEVSPAFTSKLSARNDGQHKAVKPIRLRPGTVSSIAVALDVTWLYPTGTVQSVGTPTVSGGSIEATASGPRDKQAVVVLSGTATASETRTLTVPITMRTGETINGVVDLEVFAD